MFGPTFYRSDDIHVLSAYVTPLSVVRLLPLYGVQISLLLYMLYSERINRYAKYAIVQARRHPRWHAPYCTEAESCFNFSF